MAVLVWSRNTYFSTGDTSEAPANLEEIHGIAVSFNRLLARRDQTIRWYQRDLVTLGAALKEGAENNELCPVYDKFVAKMRSNLNFPVEFTKAARRTSTYVVTATFEVESTNESYARDAVWSLSSDDDNETPVSTMTVHAEVKEDA